MNDVVREGLMIVGSYVGVLVISFALIQVLSGGFLMPFLRVRASRGKLALIKVKSVTDHYYRAGSFSERTLKYRARGQKEDKRIVIPEGTKALYRAMSVWCMDVDEETNEIITPTGKKVDTYDAEKYEQLITRALYKPALMDKNEKIMLLMIAVCILGIIIIFFFVKGIDSRVFAMQEQLGALKDITTQSIQTIG